MFMRLTLHCPVILWIGVYVSALFTSIPVNQALDVANVHVKRKQLIFHGILLTGGYHSEKKNLNKNIYK